MKKICLHTSCFIFFFALIIMTGAAAYPYDPGNAIHKDNSDIQAWAADYKNYLVGAHVDPEWQTPEKALGKAVGDSYDIVSLGRGGSITIIFSPPIINGEGADFAIFENSFGNNYFELAWVEVSSDGENFVRFDNWSGTLSPVAGFDPIDPDLLYQLAGKHEQGYGTLFDLGRLQYNVEQNGAIPDGLDLNNIRYIRLVDIVGDGSCFDTHGNIIYDPYPTDLSAGFDLDAIGVINQGAFPGDFYNDSDVDGSDMEEFIYHYVNASNPDADLNGDNIIDARDLAMFAENFGKAL